ncbi:MAG: 16S rRNA (cytidine(1402)-2'-O)-methyltransferase [Bacteroidetes bacterium]|nr:16S rRNA (cytidine(1402)-2'-O)-methyltransferase [Bacteroidota bacterium]
METKGKLYIVPTPIGNLGDITFRAVEILKSVDYILAEDTRVSSHLMKHYNITTPLKSYHQNNEHGATQRVIDDLLQGKNVAQVTDAGTPGISDPGFMLSRACNENDIVIDCLPGAVALIPALVKSGFPMNEFVFMGFLPQKKGRQTALKQLAEEERTIIIYESPHRMLKMLEEFKQYLPERKLSISRELTKKFEETINGVAEDILLHFQQKEPKGEFVVVVKSKD